MARKKSGSKQAADENSGSSDGVENTPNVQADHDSVAIGGIAIGGDLRGEVNITAGDIIKNVKTIHQRALTAAEEAARARKLENKLLAQGIATLVQSLSTQASEGTQSDSPYKGLLPYNLNEAEIFYGRDKAKRDLLSHIKQSPLTVLHAESGAGKSSLLQAGIAAELSASGHLAIYLRSREVDPGDFIKRMFLPELTQAPVLTKAPLREFLRHVCGVLGSKTALYLLLDQFEEFFNLLDKNEREPFLESLADCLNDSSLKVRWVLALRAEALSKLAELEAVGIAPFKNMYSLQRLSRAEAQEAIVKPAARHRIVFEPALIDHILNTLTTNGEVTPTHLQLVCSALTDDLPANQTLTLGHYLDHEGDTEGILRDYLKRQLEHLPTEEQGPAWKVLRALITADRLRDLKTYEELVEELKLSGVSREQIDLVLARLVERRLLIAQPAAIETFELAHDYLVKEIELDPQEQARKAAQELLDQETRTYQRHKTLLTAERLAVIQPYENELRFTEDAANLLRESIKAVQQEKRAKEQLRRRLLLGISSAVLVISTILAGWGLTSLNQNAQLAARGTQLADQVLLAQTEKENAEEQARISLSQQLAAQSIALIGNERDFELTLLLALESNYLAQDKKIPETKDALRQAMNFAPKRTIRMDGEIRNTALHPSEPIVAAVSQSKVFVFDLDTDHEEKILLQDQPVNQVLFSPDGSRLVAHGEGNFAYLWHGTAYNQIRILDQSQTIISVDFSSDSRLIITRGKTSLKVWDAANGNLLWELQAPDISNYALGNTSKSLVTLRKDGLMQVWNALTGMEITSFRHEYPVIDFAFSADDQFIITSNQDQNIYFWKADDFSLTKTFEQGKSTTDLEVQPAGKYLVAFYTPESWGPGEMWIWDIEHETVKVHQAYPDVIIDFGFDGSGNYFAVSDWNGDVEILNLGSGTRVHFNSRAPVSQLLFNGDNSLLLVSNFDGVTSIIDTETATEQAKLRNADFILDIFIYPNNSVVTTSYDGTIRLWDISNFKIPKTIKIPGDAVKIVFNPLDPKQFAVSSGHSEVQLWDISGNRSPTTVSYSSPIQNVEFSPSGEFFASVDENGTLNLIPVSNKNEFVPRRMEHVGDFSFSPDGNWLLTTVNNQLVIQRPDTFIPQIQVNFSDNIDKLIISPDGKYLIIQGKTEASMYLFSDVLQFDSHKLVPLITFQQKEAWLPVFSYDVKWLATMDSNYLVSVWDIQKRAPVMSSQHASWAAMNFSPNGLQFITGGCYDGLRVWQTGTWEPIIVLPKDNGSCLYDFSIDSTGRNILSTYSNGNVRSTNIATKQTSVISYHKVIDPFFTIKASFSPTGNRSVTSGDDGIVRVFDTDSRQMTDIIFAGDMIRDVLFSPDGKYIIASTYNEEIYIWESEINNFRDRACSILSRNLTQDEWSRFMGNTIPYHKTCSNLPPGK